MNPLDDLYHTRTNRDRKGTMPDEWNHVLLLRNLEHLISEGLLKRVTHVREIPTDFREKSWYEEIATRQLYVYVAPGERSAAEFRRYADVDSQGDQRSIQ